MIKKIGVKCELILILSFTIFLTACFPSAEFEYMLDDPELYSVAIHSILGQRGYASGSVGGDPPLIVISEEDDYGRRLFSYREGAFISRFNYVIIQKVRGDYAYFYPHYNFISASYLNYFTDERIEALKEANGWNQPMSDSSEFERVRIVRQKGEGPISRDKLFEAFTDIFPDTNLSERPALSTMIFLRTDRYGRSVYLVEGSGSEWTGTYIAILFHPDHSFNIGTGMTVIEDLHNYQTELRLFMEANGWNEPWDD